MKLNKLLLLLLFANVAFAQQITTGKIKPVKTEGLHKIMLPPGVRSFSKEDLSDFRIYDRKKNEVPYFVVQGNSRVVLKQFEEYPIVKNYNVPKKNSSYIIDTRSGNKLNGISLTVANSDTPKTYSLSGSNDQKRWFGISNDAVLDALSDSVSTTVTKDIAFPLSAYRYLKIVFDDSLTLPVNVIRAGIRRHEIRENNLQEIAARSISTEQLKEEKITVVHVVFEHAQIINRITFDVKSPRFYKRAVSVYKDATRKVRRKNVSYNEFICGFELSSQAKTSFDIPQLFVREIEIEIENRDNQPLDIGAIHFSQLPAYVIADLDPEETYTIKTGNAKLRAPDYDIEQLNNGIIEDFPETAVTEIKHNDALIQKLYGGAFWQQSWFMWVCIALGAISVLYFTLRLVRDMKK